MNPRDVFKTPCADNPEPYDILIDKEGASAVRRAVRVARELCGSCELQASCLTTNRNEPWAAAILGVDLRKPPVERKSCGTITGRSAHSRHHERPCDPCKAAEAKQRAANRSTEKWAASGITAELRNAHATHVRLRKQGVPTEDLPPSIVAGEKAYQAARHLRRKQQRAA